MVQQICKKEKSIAVHKEGVFTPLVKLRGIDTLPWCPTLDTPLCKGLHPTNRVKGSKLRIQGRFFHISVGWWKPIFCIHTPLP